ATVDLPATAGFFVAVVFFAAVDFAAVDFAAVAFLAAAGLLVVFAVVTFGVAISVPFVEDFMLPMMKAVTFRRDDTSKFLNCSTHGQAVDTQGWLTDADRYALAFLAAGANAAIERHVVADHGDAFQYVR